MSGMILEEMAQDMKIFLRGEDSSRCNAPPLPHERSSRSEGAKRHVPTGGFQNLLEAQHRPCDRHKHVENGARILPMGKISRDAMRWRLLGCRKLLLAFFIIQPVDVHGCTLPGAFYTEDFLILFGTAECLKITANGHEWVLGKEGDLVHVPGNALHAWRNTSSEAVTMLITTTKKMGHFFEEDCPAMERCPLDADS